MLLGKRGNLYPLSYFTCVSDNETVVKIDFYVPPLQDVPLLYRVNTTYVTLLSAFPSGGGGRNLFSPR